MTKLASLLGGLLLLVAAAAPARAQEIAVLIDGQPMRSDQPPVMIGGRVMVPLRGIFEGLGAEVRYDGPTRSIKATRGSTVVELALGSTQARVDGAAVSLDVPASTIGGRTMVPLRFVSEALGAEVQWEASTRTVRIRSPGTGATANPTDATDDRLVGPGEILAEARVGARGGRIQVTGGLVVDIPAGALASERSVTIRASQNAPPGTEFFFVDGLSAGEPLAKPARVTLPAPAGPGGTPPVAVRRLEGPLFVELPGARYDAERGELSVEVFHFSPLGRITSADVKAVAGTAIGTAIGVYLVTPAGVLTLPGILVVAGVAGLTGAATNPALDAIAVSQANMHAQFGDQFRIHWVDDRQSDSHLADNLRFPAYVNTSNNAVVAFEDQLTNEQRGALMGASVVPFAGVRRVEIPQSVVYLAAELFWARTFYAKAGFATPAGGADPMPRPMEVLILSDPSNQGLWDGTKLNLDSQVVAKISVLQKKHHITRQAVVAHEYWHAVYTFAGYSAPHDWWNEAMAVAFESEVFPDRNIFIDDHPAAEVAEVLRSGFVLRGSADYDADWSKRGYKLWPWGKFLLHRGYPKAIEYGTGRVAPRDLAALFGDFALALLTTDAALPDKVPVTAPADAYNRNIYVVQFPEGMNKDSFERSHDTATGWAILNLDTMRSGIILGLGSASAAGGAPGNVTVSPRPLSLTLLTLGVDPPPEVSALAKAGTPPPLVVHRELVAPQELVVALHPAHKEATTARRPPGAYAAGQGAVAFPMGWLDWSQPGRRELPLALADTATNPSVYVDLLGSETGNPLWVYFLLPPGNVRAIKGRPPSQGPPMSEGTVSLAEPQVFFTWKSPPLGPGLQPERVLNGYRVFVKKTDEEPRLVPGVLLPAAEESAPVPAPQLGEYDRIGLASEDAALKDAEGRPLLSPIGWFAPPQGIVSGAVSEVNPEAANPFVEDLVIPVVGATVTCQYLEKGSPVTRSAETDGNGQFRFEVPLDTPITISHAGKSKTVTLTAADAVQFVGFGGLQIQSVNMPNDPEIVVPPPPP